MLQTDVKLVLTIERCVYVIWAWKMFLPRNNWGLINCEKLEVIASEKDIADQ